ncbi:PRC-barrel domain-containing protein [Sphingomonas morindae]|uniref:PRC-barrel domain-containing protein n=1 Tax=Sphingomonas morindae TaxID=1541170 RepID=A0ABY4XCR2_9SPHN|nr:PRC-barrel domain-containing protein [Sphingomonas morindae]USI74761.1 PRC-barrel domain-containing protein [Sphingomonas morindae]
MDATSEPTSLLVNARTDGLKVRTRDGDALGSVHALMIDKRAGQTRFAILAIGGFLGMNKSFYPLPFELMRYDGAADDYVVTTDRRVLEGGPSWANNAPDFNQAYADRVSSYYGVASTNVDASEPGPTL